MPQVDRDLFDEAVRMGSVSVDRANLYLTVSRVLIEAIGDALYLMNTGRTAEAKARLDKALVIAANKMLP